MKRCFIFLFLAFFLISGQTLASDQKLAHGAGTLPHLNGAITLSVGLELPTPMGYALQYDRGFGNRVQLGLSVSAWGVMNMIEINSMFNVLKTANDSDFLSLYLNPSLAFGWVVNVFLRAGIAYEHRFGDVRRFGLYTKIGVLVPSMFSLVGLDWRLGFQALLGKRFSITLEPMILFDLPTFEEPLRVGKVALTWAFDIKRK